MNSERGKAHARPFWGWRASPLRVQGGQLCRPLCCCHGCTCEDFACSVRPRSEHLRWDWALPGKALEREPQVHLPAHGCLVAAPPGMDEAVQGTSGGTGWWGGACSPQAEAVSFSSSGLLADSHFTLPLGTPSWPRFCHHFRPELRAFLPFPSQKEVLVVCHLPRPGCCARNRG